MGKTKQRIKELEERVKSMEDVVWSSVGDYLQSLERRGIMFNTISKRKSDPNIPVCNITSRPVQLTKQEKDDLEGELRDSTIYIYKDEVTKEEDAISADNYKKAREAGEMMRDILRGEVKIKTINSIHYLDLIKQCGGDIGMIEAVTREWNRRTVK